MLNNYVDSLFQRLVVAKKASNEEMVEYVMGDAWAGREGVTCIDRCMFEGELSCVVFWCVSRMFSVIYWYFITLTVLFLL